MSTRHLPTEATWLIFEQVVTIVGDASVVRVLLVRMVMLVLLDPLALPYVSSDGMLSDDPKTVITFL